MRAWVVRAPGPIDSRPLEFIDKPVPEPGPGEILLRVSHCGVCRTDLHIAEGDLPPKRSSVVPGHEIVGVVDAVGQGVDRKYIGERLGIAWVRGVCGRCRYCLRGDENLCLEPQFTGWDSDGGYAEYAVVNLRFAHPIPENFDDERAAPLLCAGIIGYRALRRSQLPPEGHLGIFGFGGSAHLAAQVALFEGAAVHVFTRSEKAQQLALQLGVESANNIEAPAPDSLDAAILFAPTGELVPKALSALTRGGTLAIAGIHLTTIPSLEYKTHLFNERTVTSVTANTRKDAQEFLEIAARIPIRVNTQVFELEQADIALAALAHDQITGAAVLKVSPRE